MKRDTTGIHNRGVIKPFTVEQETVPFLPSASQLKRAITLRNLANQFRQLGEELQEFAPERSKLLKRRSQLMRLKAAMMLLGEEEQDDE